MKRFLILSVVLLLTLGSAGSLDASVQNPSVQNLIIVIWDGTQRAHLLEMLDSGELPNLQRLIDETGIGLPVIDSKKCQPGSGDGYMTQTGPANSAIATGLGYPEMANWVNWNPHPIPDGLTLWEYFKKKGYVVGIVSSKDWPFWPHTPLTNAKSEMDFWKVKPKSQEWVTLKALKFIRSHDKKLFLWVHNQQPDSLGHEFGENSPEYSEAIKKNDQELGRLLEELSTLGIRDKTLVVVTPDHGFKEDGRHHRDCIVDTKELFLVVSDNGARILRCVKDQTDIAPCLKRLFKVSQR